MNLFDDVIPSLDNKSGNLLDANPADERTYKHSCAFMVNKHYSQFWETVLFSEVMNRYYDLPGKMQYDFYYHGLPKLKGKFRGKWSKKDPDSKHLEIVQEYFEYSEQKAKEILKVLTPEQIEEIEKSVYKGSI